MADIAEITSLLDKIEAVKAENAALEEQIAASGQGKGEVIIADTPDKIPLTQPGTKVMTAYWNICGLGQPIRYALELANIPYSDVRIEAGEAASADYKQMWMGKKPEVGVPFANLPYFFDGDVKLVQSNAILRHIGRTYGLAGNNFSLLELVIDEASDLDDQVTGKCYRAFDTMKEFFETGLVKKLKSFTEFLGSNTFMTGDVVTVADCKLYELLRKIRIIEQEQGTAVFAKFPELQKYTERFEALPAIQRYQAGPSFLSRPMNNPHAQFK
jgi:glutathione S-transferase